MVPYRNTLAGGRFAVQGHPALRHHQRGLEFDRPFEREADHARSRSRKRRAREPGPESSIGHAHLRSPSAAAARAPNPSLTGGAAPAGVEGPSAARTSEHTVEARPQTKWFMEARIWFIGGFAGRRFCRVSALSGGSVNSVICSGGSATLVDGTLPILACGQGGDNPERPAAPLRCQPIFHCVPSAKNVSAKSKKHEVPHLVKTCRRAMAPAATSNRSAARSKKADGRTCTRDVIIAAPLPELRGLQASGAGLSQFEPSVPLAR